MKKQFADWPSGRVRRLCLCGSLTRAMFSRAARGADGKGGFMHEARRGRVSRC